MPRVEFESPMRSPRSLFDNDIVLVDLAVQRIAADAESLRGAADIPVHSLEFAQQCRAFGIAQGGGRQVQRRRGGRRGVPLYISLGARRRNRPRFRVENLLR